MLAQALIDISPSDRQISLQIGEPEAGVLKASNRLPKGLAFVDIVLGDVEGPLGGGDRVQGDRQSLLRQLAHQRSHGTAFKAQQVACGNAHLVEEQLGCIRGKMAELVEVAAAAKAGAIGLDEKE